MANSFTLLWSKSRLEAVKMHAGEPLTILFGGPHQSEPGFRRFGVREGDDIYPVTAASGVLYILGRINVDRLLSIDEYISDNAEAFKGYESSFGGETTFGNWMRAHPELLYLAPTCTNEVILGEGTRIGMMAAVPPDVLEALCFCSQRGERVIKHVVNGRLNSVASLQGGVYRLSDASAQKFAEIVAASDLR